MGCCLASALGVLLAATRVTAAAEARTEAQAGAYAGGSTSSPYLASDLEVTPRLSLTARHPRASAEVSYGPRLLLMWPTSFERGPLVLHQVEAAHQARLSRHLDYQLGLYASAGELSYQRALEVFDAERDLAASLPAADVIGFAAAGGILSAGARLDRRNRLGVTASAGWTSAFAATEVAAFPELIQAHVAATYTADVAPRDEVGLSAELGGAEFSPGPDYVTAGGRGTWRRRLDGATRLALSLGLLRGLRADVELERALALKRLEGRYEPYLPIAELGIDRVSRPWPGVVLELSLGAGAQRYLDPIRAALYPGAFLSGRLDVTLPHDLGARGLAYFFSPATPTWPETDPQGFRSVPSLAALQAALIYRGLPQIEIEAGLRSSAHAPHWASTQATISQPGVVAYGAIVARLDREL